MISGDRFSSLQRSGNDFVNRAPATAQLQLAGFDARQFNQPIYETTQAIALFVDHFHHLYSRVAIECSGKFAAADFVEQCRDRSLDGSERRA